MKTLMEGIIKTFLGEDGEAAKQAKQMGLVSKGWGRWADPRTGKITHKSDGNRLVPIQSNEPEPSTNVPPAADPEAGEESKLKSAGITDFKSFFKKLPGDLQKRVYALKDQPQRTDHHPEGNVLKHTITVVKRALKDDDIDIAIAAMFHDIGKDSTAGTHPKKGHITHFGHEKTSAELVEKYRDWIESVGGDADAVHFIVKNHMRYKKMSDMRPAKQDKLKSHPSFDKLDKFSKHDRGGLGEVKKNLLDVIIEGFVREAGQAAQQAKQMGLVSKGWGRWADPRTGKITHKTDNDRLVPVKSDEEEPEGEPTGGEDPQAGQQSPDDAIASDPQLAKIARAGAERGEEPEGEPQGTLSDSGDDLSDNDIKQTALNKGYVPGAAHTAPGNAGSMFHEIVTGEVSNWLFEDDSILESEDAEKALAEKICSHFSTTTLGKAGSPKGVGIGKEKNWKIGAKSSTCRKVARAGIKKYEFVKAGVDALVAEGKLTEPVKVRNYFGAKESIQKQKELIEQCSKVEGGGNFYTPSGVQIDPNDLLFFIEKSGGGENPADTSTIAMDDNCNGVVSFHSDKMSPGDPQANSSVSAEFEFFASEIKKLRESGVDFSESDMKSLAKDILDTRDSVRTTELKLKGVGIEASGAMLEMENFGPLLDQLRQPQKPPTARYVETFVDKNPPHHYIQTYCEEDCDTEEGRLKAFLRYMNDSRELCLGDGGEPKTFGTKQWAKLSPNSECKPAPTEDMGKFILRAGKTAYLMGDKKDKRLNMGAKIGQIREEAAGYQHELHRRLNERKININGGEIGLGDYLEAKNVIEKFHLALLDDRERPDGGRSLGAYDNLLNINMTDTLSTAQDIGDCLQIKNADDLMERFVVGTPENEGERWTTDDEGNITGRVIFLYAVTSDKGKIKIGEKTMRAKSGQQGKWETLYSWSNEMQNCLKSPSEQPQESAPPELKKLIRDIALWKMNQYGN